MITAIFENNQLVSYSLKTWQYDYGQILRIEGLNLPTAVEIHFSLTEKGGEAVTRIGMTKDGVTDVVIPDNFLENNDITQDYRIYAFIYLRDDTSGQTEYKVPISVTSRPKPEAFDRPEDGEIFKEAIQAVRESADQAAESARQAEAIKESVQDMVDTIGNVDEKVQAVKGFAQKAETASNNAALSEKAAKESEAAAELSKTAAETARTAAEESADSARRTATMVETARQEVATNKTAVEQAVSGFDGKVVEANIAIESAKTAAVKAVEDKGNEVLQSIPQDLATSLQSALISQKISGGGITTITDSSDNQVKDFGLIGNTEQAQTTGAQLIPPMLSEKKTINGITFEPVSKNKIKVYGTATEDSVMPYNYFTIKPGTYTFSINQKVIKSKFRVCFMNKKGQPKFDISNAQSSSTDVFDTEEQATVLLRIFQGVEINMNICFMFNEGGSALPYELYTGGKPSPSPEYPQEIKNVGKWNEEKQKYEIDVKVTNAEQDYDKEQTLTLTSDRPITKWDKLVEQDGQIGWLYGAKRYAVTGSESWVFADSQYYSGISTNMYTNTVTNFEKVAVCERLKYKNTIWGMNDKQGFCLNATNQLHIRFFNEILGVADEATKEEKQKAYVAYLKSEYEKGTPYEIVYKSTDTEFIPLPQSEQNAIRALTTYYPTTVITADGGEVDPNIEVTYIADTKNYIDQKIEAINKAIVTTQKALL